MPTFNFCGGRKPLRSRVSFELSVGTGTCHVTFAYDLPGSVGIFSKSGGHLMLGGWMSVKQKKSFQTNISILINCTRAFEACPKLVLRSQRTKSNSESRSIWNLTN